MSKNTIENSITTISAIDLTNVTGGTWLGDSIDIAEGTLKEGHEQEANRRKALLEKYNH